MKKQNKVTNVIKGRRILPKPDHRDVGAILLFVFLLPYIISFFFGNSGTMNMQETAMDEAMYMAKIRAFEEDPGKAQFIVCNKTAVGTEMIPLETYLASRLPATIDMNYEPETLKAQAVVLRTELLRQYDENLQEENKEEEDGKKYIYVESRISILDEESYEKAMEAVGSTRGMYLTYKGYPIKAPYFAVSAGATRNGNEAFNSKDYAYLKSVLCERDFTAENYTKSIQMNKSAFYEKLRSLYGEAETDEEDNEKQRNGDLADSLQINRDRAGYVTEIGFGGEYIAGEKFRKAFLLSSSHFELEEEGDMVQIRTKGVGHGLGFGQYGANEAAKKGSDFIDILNYFFSGIVIEKTE